ncbi:ArsA family ATPase [Caldisericum exile]|uniref:arsenite-transporting ATPase n=1 Tax=Caldisericum exile (strain DSM 21853 / NBRC 104410 / AZM16c01) TaxID=511051 RepID=A0A7U6GE50_CALEA|nr:ArsA family ATPase [Caldisericum exile]BAL80711.1 anion-transporting ATPase family protein [Caldisericum exile AZM16c01]
MQTFFFIGKGGVGKTTISASFASGLAKKGLKTLIVSLDPAHNLGDALNKDVFGKVVKISDNLDATEVDIDRAIVEYLTEMSKKMKNTYKYLSVLNIDRYFDVLRNSPGIEEYVTLEAIRKFLETDYSAIVFDTPPTGITLRVFAMPRISVVWTNSLIDMRRRILSKRQMVENIKGPISDVLDGEEVKIPSKESEDPVMQELFTYKKDMVNLMERFSSEENYVSVVTMAEELAFAESKRIRDALRENNIKLRRIYLNKYLEIENPPRELLGKIEEQKRVVEKMRKEFNEVEIREVPLLTESPRGIEALISIYEKYLV